MTKLTIPKGSVLVRRAAGRPNTVCEFAPAIKAFIADYTAPETDAALHARKFLPIDGTSGWVNRGEFDYALVEKLAEEPIGDDGESE